MNMGRVASKRRVGHQIQHVNENESENKSENESENENKSDKQQGVDALKSFASVPTQLIMI